MSATSVLNPKYGDNFPERGARLARREERAYREYGSDEQRRQAGAPAARFVRGGVEKGCPARQMSAYFASETLTQRFLPRGDGPRADRASRSVAGVGAAGAEPRVERRRDRDLLLFEVGEGAE